MRVRAVVRSTVALQALLLIATLLLQALACPEVPVDRSTPPTPTEQPSDPPAPDPTTAPATPDPTAPPASEPDPTAPPAPDPTTPPTPTPTEEPTYTPSGPPSIASDKPDYAPGELVTLTGSNWFAGESVNIYVNDDQGRSWSRRVDVTANATGEITDQFNLPSHFVAEYVVIATGAHSGMAITTFTDGNVKARTNATGFTFQLNWTRHNGDNQTAQVDCNAPAAQQTS